MYRIRRRAPRVAAATLAGIGVAAWLAYSLANGPSHFGDTPSYLTFADALENGQLPPSERTPGYPLFIVACRLLAAETGLDPDVAVTILQVLLLAGLCTLLLYDLAYRLTESVAVATVTAGLFVADADVQSFSGAILSDALATTIAVALIWVAVRDAGWRRAGWLCALLVLTRPAYLFVPFVFAGIEACRARRWGAGLAPLLPTLVLAGLWGLLGSVVGARPLTPFTRFGPLHSFAKVYEFDLWRVLPDGPERRLIAEERGAGHTVYEAASRLAGERGVDAVYDVVGRTLRAAPLRFTLSVARALPRAFRQASLWRPNHEDDRAFPAVVLWHGWYREALYWPIPLLALFGTLMIGAMWNGLGWPRATPALRTIITPFIAERFLSTALLAMGTDAVGRLAMAFRPFYCLLLALTGVRLYLVARSITRASGVPRDNFSHDRALPDRERRTK